jgi:hypothetical protein
MQFPFVQFPRVPFRTQLAVLALLAVGAVPLRASSFDDKPIDEQSISALEAKILQAQPREQCFLYAELVHEMTEFSVRQYASGDEEKATGLLKQIQVLAHKIHLTMSEDNKRLKNAQILLRHTSFRLNEMLHNSSLEDRPLVAETLSQVNQAQDEAMMQVFRK